MAKRIVNIRLRPDQEERIDAIVERSAILDTSKFVRIAVDWLLRSDIGEVIKKIVDEEEAFPNYQIPKKAAGRKKWTMNKTALAILAALCASLSLADDFKTVEGKEYKNVTVSRVEPDGITVKNTKAGVIVKLYFTELPKEVQQQYNYDPAKADEYATARAQRLQEQNEAREEPMRQKEEATRRNNEQLGKEQAGIQWTQEQRQKIQALQNRYNELQQQEDDLLVRGRKSRSKNF
jgi:uncharacterized protein YeaO (DUF488 family)